MTSDTHDNSVVHAAKLLAELCTSQGTIDQQRELTRLIRSQRITLSEFSRALNAVTEARGAAATQWHKDQQRHTWLCERVWEEVEDAGMRWLHVLLTCTRCASSAELRIAHIAPCEEGKTWEWTGTSWTGLKKED